MSRHLEPVLLNSAESTAGSTAFYLHDKRLDTTNKPTNFDIDTEVWSVWSLSQASSYLILRACSLSSKPSIPTMTRSSGARCHKARQQRRIRQDLVLPSQPSTLFDTNGPFALLQVFRSAMITHSSGPRYHKSPPTTLDTPRPRLREESSTRICGCPCPFQQ